MMSKLVNTSTPKQKPQPHFKIVYSAGPDGHQSLKGAKLGRPQGSVRSNDLDAAIKSITYATGTDNQTFETIGSATKDIRKINFNSSQGDQKLEKIVFLPKFVQKKVTVLKDTPKKIGLPGTSRASTTPKARGLSRLLSPIKQKKNELNNHLFPKKRKLGDVALESWNLKTESAENGGNSVLCRICGSFVEGEVVDLVEVSGTLTKMGLKLKAIVGTDITDSPLYPPACCKQCSVKLSMCFSLLMEVQASDEVVRSTYSDVKEGDLINPNNHIYTCRNCEHEVVGMKEYIHHFEDHMQEKCIGTDEGKVSDDEDDPTLAAQVFLEEEATDGSLYYQNDLGEYVCETCGRSFKYVFLLQLHRKAPKRDPVQRTGQACFVCKQHSTSTVTSDEVCNKCHGVVEAEETEDEEGKVNCDICQKKVLAVSLPAHKLKHVQRLTCQICNSTFPTKNSLFVHMKMHDEDESPVESKCHVCLQVLPNARVLRKHLNDEHDIQFDAVGAFQCEHCSKAFDDLFKLKIHLKLYHNVELPLALKAPRVKRFECHVCKLILHSENSARIHMRKVHNLTNNQMESLKQACEECGKIFSVKQNLINHINSAHLKVKPMSCEYCGERFGKHSSLIFHRLRHTGEKPFKCSLCAKSYRQRNDVMRHLARHVRDRELEYDEAYAINTSNSKFIFKRFVYLKDSTIKGLVELALCATPPKRKRMALKERKSVDEEDPNEVYEELVLPEGAVVMDENGEIANVQYVTADGQQYVVAGEDENGEGIGENVQYIVNDDGEQYVLKEENDGEEQYVLKDNDEDGGEQYVLNDEDGGEQYVLNDEDGEEQYVVKDQDGEEHYVLKNKDGVDEHYVLQKNESGDQILVPWEEDNN